MDKLFDAVVKIIPAYLLLAVAGVALAFFSTYYWRGYRSYSDGIRDHTFQTLAVVLAIDKAFIPPARPA